MRVPYFGSHLICGFATLVEYFPAKAKANYTLLFPFNVSSGDNYLPLVNNTINKYEL